MWSVPLPGLAKGIGDVNLDGFGDIVVGNKGASSSPGEVLVLSGVDGSVIHRYAGSCVLAICTTVI